MNSSRRGNQRAAFYQRLLEALPDERFVFMNHGYLEPGQDARALGDAPLQLAANLVRRMTRGVTLEGKLALDVGCGRGGASACLAHDGCRRVIGLDFDAGQVAFCRRVHRDERLSFVRGDAQDLPLADGSADIVFNLESSHCYPDLPRFFAEARRVLADDGVFLYADALDGAAAGAIAARTALLVESGFAVREQADITRAVADALFIGFEEQARFFFDAIARDRRHEALLLRALKGVTLAPCVGYVTGKISYGLWRLSRR